jgi:FkbM family methyltransferase
VIQKHLKRMLVKHIFQKTDIVLTARLHTGDKLRVDLASSVGRSIWFRHCYGRDVERVIRSILMKGDVFIDIGANVGYFSVIAARLVGDKGKVYSLEAIPKIYDLLTETIVINDMNNIYPFNNAVYSENTKLRFCNMKDSAFSHISKDDNITESPIDVDSITLDSLIKEFGTVNAMKIDVEGAEMDVLLGGNKLIDRCRPKIVMEVQDWSLQRFGYCSKDVLGLLRNTGYKVYDLKYNLYTGESSVGNYTNLLFIHDGDHR